MIDERCLEVLFFPPMFARSVTHLTDQETYLEDSSGRRWRVTVCIHNGSLAIRQGWPEFLSEHGVDVGNFLVFHYVPASKHFIVQIFGTMTLTKKEKEQGLTWKQLPRLSCLKQQILNIRNSKKHLSLSSKVSLLIQKTHYPLMQSAIYVWWILMAEIFCNYQNPGKNIY